MARTITFQPSEKQGELIESLIKQGGYNNQSEVIREGLRLLEEKEAESKLAQLKNLIDEGEQSGDLVTWNAKDFIKKMKS